jgi:tetratricopeptide (TPR) repeat protein
LYATGRYYWDTRSRDGVRRSLTYFAGVIDESPLDARGYAAMADANVTMGDYCFGTHAPSVYFARAQYYAQRALALDANSAAAHASLGFIALHQGRTADALRQLGRAIALDPSYAPAREWYGIALLRNRDLERGLPQLKIAERLDPLSVSTIAWIASVARAQHRYSTAVLYTRMTRELLTQPINAQAHVGADHATWAAIETAPMFSLVNV